MDDDKNSHTQYKAQWHTVNECMRNCSTNNVGDSHNWFTIVGRTSNFLKARISGYLQVNNEIKPWQGGWDKKKKVEVFQKLIEMSDLSFKIGFRSEKEVQACCWIRNGKNKYGKRIRIEKAMMCLLN